MQRKYVAEGVYIEKDGDVFNLVYNGEVISSKKSDEPINEITIKQLFSEELEAFSPSPMEGPKAIVRKLTELEKRLAKIESKLEKHK